MGKTGRKNKFCQICGDLFQHCDCLSDDIFCKFDGKITDLTLDYLELSQRAINCLKNMGVNTLGEIDNMTDIELLSFPCLGDETLGNIRTSINTARVRWHRHRRV